MEAINRYEYIDYEVIKYPYIWLNIPEFGVYRVATLSLINALVSDDDGITYKSNNARAIDEMFFFYLDDDEMDRNDEELAEVILKAVA